MDLGPLEILLILAVVIMIFGVGKLPEIGSTLGKSIREFRNATRDEDTAPKQAGQQTEAPNPPPGRPCASCGASNSSEVRFCTNCGQPLKA
jgi:sec-independent protein translocase protein TatA